MKKNLCFLSVAMAALALASCSGNEDTAGPSPSSQVAISISNSIASFSRAATDVQGAQIAQNVKIGLFSFVTGKTVSAKTTTSQQDYIYSNIAYTANGDGTFAVASPQAYYPTDGSTVDLYAYAPYSSSFAPDDISNTSNSVTNLLGFTVKSNQSAAADYEASDLLWATPRNSVASKTTAEPLSFAHKLTKVTVKLVKAVGSPITDAELQSAKIEVLGTKPTTSLNVQSGDIAEASGTVTSIVAQAANSASVEAAAIIVPQTVAEKTVFLRVTIGEKNGTGGTKYEYAIPTGGITFTTAHNYVYTITVVPTGIQVSSTIVDWVTGAEYQKSGDATQPN